MELYLLSRMICFTVSAVLIVMALVGLKRQQKIRSWVCFSAAAVLPLLMVSYQPNVRPAASLTPSMTQATEAREPRPLPGIGRFVALGSFEQDGNPDNGPETISWQVLAQEEDRVLVVSFYPLDRRRYLAEPGSCTWETSDARAWLNGEFFNTAFNAGEQQQILLSTLDNAPNPDHGVSSGPDTQDHVFLLSYEEIKAYMSSEVDRLCKPTQLARNHDAYINDSGNCWWLLRTAGENSRSVMYINSDGSFNREGCVTHSDGGVLRPAMWLRWE